MNKNPQFVLGTAGHIDHGKTALLRALTGVDTDRLPEEKKRGITIDLGFAALELGSHRLAVVDVPGHERFIRNMLAGATGLDFALLVIAADDSVMPQTREHLEILKLLGITQGVIAITKTDLVDPDWLALVREDVRTLVAGSFLQDSPVIPTSAISGVGLAELKQALQDLCQNGKPRRESGLFRLAIDRSFTLSGHGTIVTGTVASGSVEVGQSLELWPSGRTVRVRGIHQHDQAVDRVGRGARAAINLVGVHHTEVGRGDVLAAPGSLVATRRLSVEVQATSDAPRALRSRNRYRVYLGTAEVTGRLAFFGEEPGQIAGPTLAQLVLAEPVVAVHGQPFVIREESPPATLGGGRVLQPNPRRIRRRDRASIDRLEGHRSADPSQILAACFEEIGLGDWTVATLSRDSGIPADEIPVHLQELEGLGKLVEVQVGPRRTLKCSRAVVEGLEDRILRTLRRLHESSPRLSAIPRPRLITALADLDHEGLVQALIQRLLDRKLVSADIKAVAIRGFEPKLSQAERRLKAEIAEAFVGTAFTPPDLDEWSKRPGLKASMVIDLFNLLCDEERLANLGGGLYLEADALVELRRKVTGKLADGSTLSMSELRDLLGTTRKYAVPIGEYLDRSGLTVREGDVRKLKASAPAG